jgi:hypothetical protein
VGPTSCAEFSVLELPAWARLEDSRLPSAAFLHLLTTCLHGLGTTQASRCWTAESQHGSGGKSLTNASNTDKENTQRGSNSGPKSTSNPCQGSASVTQGNFPETFLEKSNIRAIEQQFKLVWRQLQSVASCTWGSPCTGTKY